ncbi:MAG: ECF-type sigma factor [Gimesia sp.]|nr:ECF-type sigma factor [Gimesia sp.]
MPTRSPEPEDGSISHLWRQMQTGDQHVSSDLYSRLLPRMYAIAQKSVGPIVQRGVELDDIVQSAMVSFWKYSDAGKLSSNLNRNDLWCLISVFTTRKMKKHIRRESAQKRGAGKVLGEHGIQGVDGAGERLDELVPQVPTQEYDLAIEELLNPLDEELTRIALLKLSEYTNIEISKMLDCTERTVERKLHLIREIWSRLD